MNNFDLIKIGQFLSDLRKKKDLTQAELGDLVGASPKTISKWENGNSFPDANYHQELCGALGIFIEELYAGEYNKEQRKLRKFHKIINIIMMSSLIIMVPLIIFLGTYFCINYKSLKIYYVSNSEKESNVSCRVRGLYVDSTEGNVFYVGKIDFVDLIVKDTDIISIDFYSDDELVYHHNSLEFDAITFTEKTNINKDNFKVKIQIITTKNDTYEYEVQLAFRKTDKNVINKYGNELMLLNNVYDLELALKNDGYQKVDENAYKKIINTKNSNTVISYVISEKRISYTEDKNNINKKIIFNGTLNVLETYIYHNNKNVHTLVEKYTYNFNSDTLICDVGICSTLDEIKELMAPYISLLFGE